MMKINRSSRLVMLRRLCWFFFIGGLFLAVGCKKKRDVLSLPYMAPFKNLSEDVFAIAFLSSFEGYVEPCGCTSNPLGGLARFATVFDDIKTVSKNRIAIIDGGNLLFDSVNRNDADRCQDDSRIDLLLSTLANLGLTITIAGPLDDARGVDFRKQVNQKHGLIPLTPIGKLEPKATAAPFLRLIKTPSYDIGIIGVSNEKGLSANELKKNIATIVKMAKTSERLKAVIAISQMPLASTKEVFNDAEGVDIVIQGQVTSSVPGAPVRLGQRGPELMEGGRQGQYFTVLLLQNLSLRKAQALTMDNRGFDRTAREDLLKTRLDVLSKQAKNAPEPRLEFLKKRLALAKNELINLKNTSSMPPLGEPNVAFHTVALTKKIDADSTVKQQLLDYESSVPLLVKTCEEHIVCPKAEPGAAVFVGANACKACHQEAYNVWQEAVFLSKGLDDDGKEITRPIGHSKAWQTLVDAHKDADRSCIGCHSVGFMTKGGYCKAFDVGFRKNVQCESCHGPGSLHAQSGDKRFIERKVSEETCRGCHHVPHIQSYESFNYEEKLIEILGKGHGENLLKQLRHTVKKTES